MYQNPICIDGSILARQCYALYNITFTNINFNFSGQFYAFKLRQYQHGEKRRIFLGPVSVFIVNWKHVFLLEI
jgi:hypothetical protein